MLHVSGVEPRFLGSVPYSLVSIATELYIYIYIYIHTHTHTQHSVTLPEDSSKLGTFCLIIVSNNTLLQGKRSFQGNGRIFCVHFRRVRKIAGSDT